jgi:hypothetical protein
MNKILLLMISLSCCMVGCNKNHDQNLEKLVKYCWIKYGEESEGLMDDPKCSNWAVIGRLSEIGNNRKCGYPDLYHGARNLNDLSKLNKKDRQYIELVLNCTEQYLKYAAPCRIVPNGYEESSLPQVLVELKTDHKCNIPAVKERIEFIMLGRRGNMIGDEGICRP